MLRFFGAFFMLNIYIILIYYCLTLLWHTVLQTSLTMLHKTEGIVLGSSRYSDRYSIVRIFTRDFGTVSYLLPFSQNKKAKIKTSLFFPLSVLNLEVEHMPLREIHRLKDAERQFPLYDICNNIVKVSLAFFLSEFLFRVVRETDNNEFTFDFVKKSVETLEAAEKGVANFHIAFIIGLTRFTGIYPNWENMHNYSYFDMLNGEFRGNVPTHTHFLNREQSVYLANLQRINYGNMHLFRLSRENRNIILDYLIEYYRLHLYEFPKLKSLEVLRDMV